MTSSLARAGFLASFLAGALTTLLVVLGMTFWGQHAGPTQQLPAPPASPSSSSASPSLDPNAGDYQHDHDAAEDEKPSWEPVLLGFAKNFANTDDRNAARWRQRLAPHVAPAVRDQLGEVDPSKIPAGQYRDYELLKAGSYQLAVKVNYREGWALILYVTSDGHRWKVTAYDRWEE